ncbi:MAG: septal ring lytic transglycosylase RlpA family protein [Aquificaceae bacterium]|nr:septal ring lytic transglycosylase RlpA family protein [Aquificaceae bacterium]
MRRLIPLLLTLCLSCSVVVRERTEEAVNFLKVNCPDVVYTTGFYCDGDRAYSDKLQSGSRVRIVSLQTGKSITIAVFRRDDVKGICVPEKFKGLLGEPPFKARVEVQRCGVDDKRECTGYIRGLASYYKDPYHGRETPYGVKYDAYQYYAASPDLPLGSLAKVRNLKNGKEVIVKIIDRGPFKEGRVIDLSYRAAEDLDMLRDGITEVEIKVIRCGE